MLLSNQQKYIISVLRQIKYIRSCQLCALTAQHYRPQGIEISQHRMDVMLRQLRAGTNFVRLQEDIVCYGKRTVDPQYLEAIDVMPGTEWLCSVSLFIRAVGKPFPASIHRLRRGS